MQLWPTTEGLCFLTEVSGKFRGLAEGITLEARDGHWWLSGRSRQTGVGAVARCVTWASFQGIDTPVINNPAGTSVQAQGGISNQTPLTYSRQLVILSGVGGKFRGGAETAQVWAPPEESNGWRVGASSYQPGHPVYAQAISVSLGTTGRARIVTHATWRQGEAPVTLMPVSIGVCYLAGMAGRFEGDGETVRVTERDGRWLLDGTSLQEGVQGYAYCLAYDQTDPGRRPRRAGCFPENYTYCIDCQVARETRERAGCSWEGALAAIQKSNVGCNITQGPCRGPDSPCPGGGSRQQVYMCCNETKTEYVGEGCSIEEAEQGARQQDLSCSMTTGECDF